MNEVVYLEKWKFMIFITPFPSCYFVQETFVNQFFCLLTKQKCEAQGHWSFL